MTKRRSRPSIVEMPVGVAEAPAAAGLHAYGERVTAVAPRSISIIVPAYNEAERLPRTLLEIREFLEAGNDQVEVIVVDDGSTDDTAARVLALQSADPRFRLVRLPANRGKGAAVRAGVSEAAGEYILFSDADGSTPIAELERLWKEIDAGADVAIGSRGLSSDEVSVQAKLSRNLLGRLFQQLVRTVAVQDISDTQCGFKLFRASVARDLFASTRNERFTFDIELLMLARHRAYRVSEVAVNWTHVPGSKVRVLRDGVAMGLDVLRMRLAFMRGAYGEARPAAQNPELVTADASGEYGSGVESTDEWRARWWGWVAVSLGVFLVANRKLVRGDAVGLWDADSQFFPYFSIVADYARAGRFMMWDPWTTGGLPTFAEPQVGALSPINNLAGLLTGGSSAGFVGYWLTMWFLGGVGIFLLGRHLRAPVWGSCVVALGYLFCGVYTGQAQHTSWVVGFSFLPLVIWRLDVSLLQRRILPAVQAGALWGLAALSAHPSVIILTGCFAALWVAGRCVGEGGSLLGNGWSAARSDRAQARSTDVVIGFSALAVVAVVGIGILAPTYHSFVVEGAGVTGRVGALTRTDALTNELDPKALVTVISAFPHRLATSHPRVIFPRSDVSMASIYSGVLIPVLALLALFGDGRGRWRWWLAGLGVLSLACAIGESLPLRGWLYDVFYPMRVFRHSAVFRLFFLFSMTVLALLGTREVARLLQSGGNREWRRLAGLAAIAAVVAVTAYAAFLWDVRHLSFSRLAYLMPLPWIVLVLIAGAAVKVGHERRRLVVPLLLVLLAAGDAVLTAELSQPTMLREGAAVERWRDLDRAKVTGFDLMAVGLDREESPCTPAPERRCRSNDQLITKQPTFNANPTQRHEAHQAMLAMPVLKQTAIGAQRVWFATDVAHVPPVRASFEAFSRRADAVGRPPLVVHSREGLIGSGFEDPAEVSGAEAAMIAGLPAMEPAEVQLVAYGPEELIFDVEAPRSGWLLVTDRWAPSWEATVDGRSIPLLGGNFVFRALQVPQGRSRVALAYRPRTFPWLVAVSWTAMGVVLVLSIWAPAASAIRRRRRRHDSRRDIEWAPIASGAR